MIFWHLGEETDKLRTANELTHHLDTRNETDTRRREACNNIVIALLEKRATLAESVEAMLAVANASPEWFASLVMIHRTQYIGPKATERDVARHYLILKIKTMRTHAEQRGDLAQAAAISARLVELNEELQADVATCDKSGAH